MFTKLAFIGMILYVISLAPAYATVTSFSIENDVYTNEESIVFVGTESEGKKTVNVAVYDTNGKFINMLGDPSSEIDGSFETLPKLVSALFTKKGTYNATAFTTQISEGVSILLNYDGNQVSLVPNFVLNLNKIGSKTVTENQLLTFTTSVTDSSLTNLSFKLDKSPPSGATIDSATGKFSWTPTSTQGPGTYVFDIVVSKGALEDRETITVTVNDAQTTPSATNPEPEPEPTKNVPNFIDPKKGAQYYLDRYNTEPAYKQWFDTNYPDYTIQQAIELAIPGSFSEPDPAHEPEPTKNLAPFVDPDEDPQYYIDRYNNEPSFKEWFDQNFPDQTIFDAVGLEPPKTGICGKGTQLEDGICVVVKQGGGCLIATAAYGSEMSVQVQHLRELRDNTLLDTNVGSSFMDGFNSVYYTFSPTIADWERQSPIFKNAVKITITPLIASLSILNYVDVDSESELIGYGLSILLLNLGMYVVGPTFAIIQVRKHLIQ